MPNLSLQLQQEVGPHGGGPVPPVGPKKKDGMVQTLTQVTASRSRPCRSGSVLYPSRDARVAGDPFCLAEKQQEEMQSDGIAELLLISFNSILVVYFILRLYSSCQNQDKEEQKDEDCVPTSKRREKNGWKRTQISSIYQAVFRYRI